MTARARLEAAADRIPLPAETLAGVVAAMLAQRVRTLRLPAWARPAGLVVAGGGLALVAAAWRERGSGSLEEPRTLVTRGLHGRSRNPIYLGCSAVHLGLAAGSRNAWMLASFPVSAALLHRWVLREERWLRERFGDEYEAYRARVPRYFVTPRGMVPPVGQGMLLRRPHRLRRLAENPAATWGAHPPAPQRSTRRRSTNDGAVSVGRRGGGAGALPDWSPCPPPSRTT